MSSAVPCLRCHRTQSNKAPPIEAGSLQRCPCLLRDVAISSEMSRKSCCHEVARETQSEEGNGLSSEPDLTFDKRRAGLCVSGHADVQLAGAVILGVDIRHMNREGQRSAEVRCSPAHQLCSSEARLLRAKWETASANIWYEYIWSTDKSSFFFSFAEELLTEEQELFSVFDLSWKVRHTDSSLQEHSAFIRAAELFWNTCFFFKFRCKLPRLQKENLHAMATLQSDSAVSPASLWCVLLPTWGLSAMRQQSPVSTPGSVVTNSSSSCGFYCRGKRKGSQAQKERICILLKSLHHWQPSHQIQENTSL